jgi:cell filamentation protein
MGRYEGDERGLYPGTDVLINKLDIRDKSELDQAEAAIVLLAAYELAQTPLPEPAQGPDFSYLIDIHQVLFRDVYEWAGQVREVDISKGDTRFANCRHIVSEVQKLVRKLAAENWLEGLAVEQFAKRMAYYMGELNVLHPFREGNGRSLREYVRHLAERAGHSISWEGVSSREMINASISAYQGKYQPLENLLLRQLVAGSTKD